MFKVYKDNVLIESTVDGSYIKAGWLMISIDHDPDVPIVIEPETPQPPTIQETPEGPIEIPWEPNPYLPAPGTYRLEVVAPPPTLTPLSSARFRVMMLTVMGITPTSPEDDLYEMLNAAMRELFNSIEDPLLKAEAQIYWLHATMFERYDPILVRMAAVMGLTDEQIDDFWIAFM